MERLSFSNRLTEIKKTPQKKIDWPYQELGIQIADYFKCKTKEFWFLFFQVEEWKIRTAFNEAQKAKVGVKDFVAWAKNTK